MSVVAVCRTGIQFAVRVRVLQIMERVSGERLPLIACIRKGKHMIARIFGLMDKDQSVAVLQDMCKHMSQIVRKDMNEEVKGSLQWKHRQTSVA